MGNTYTSLRYHVVFSTKDRARLLSRDLPRVHEYVGGCARELGATPLRIGGVDDHVHALLGLKPTQNVSDLLRDLKTASSKWLSTWIPSFHWQDGYSAFTVSPSQVDRVRDYIERQEEHHRKRPFVDELRSLLVANGVAFDERYLL